MGIFDVAIRGVWGFLKAWFGNGAPSPDKPTIPSQDFAAWKASLPDGCFIAVHKLTPAGSKDNVAVATSDGINAAEQGYWSHVISGKYGDNCFEAILPCFSLTPLSAYNDPSQFQLVAFVFDLTAEEVAQLRMFYASQLGKPYPIREIVHDAIPIVPSVTNGNDDCSGTTAVAWQKCVPRFRIFPSEMDSRPQDVTPQQIYNWCYHDIANCKVIPWNVNPA